MNIAHSGQKVLVGHINSYENALVTVHSPLLHCSSHFFPGHASITIALFSEWSDHFYGHLC